MSFIDYYKILESHPHASSAELKKAYRNLARRYHPDSNSSDPKATQYFQEIQSAYEVLSNPLKRKTFDNELKAKGQYSTFAKDSINSVEQILKQSKDLYIYVKGQDRRAINTDALTDFILGLLNKDNMALLLRANNTELNTEISNNLLLASKSITAPRLFEEIAGQLLLLHPDLNSQLHIQIKSELNNRLMLERQNKIVPYAALAIVLLIILVMCIILFL
ncbi:MAG: J domain-containing protein [Bacteroidota bacterium]